MRRRASLSSSSSRPSERDGTEKRERKAKEDAGEAGSSGKPFHMVGYCTTVKDLNGKPLLLWDGKGKSVTVSTALPSWKSETDSHQASAATAALYGKKNYEELMNISPKRLPSMAAQATARSTVMNHFMGRYFRHSLKDIAEMKERLERAYDLHNPIFRKEIFEYLRDCVEETINRLRDRNAIKEDFVNVSFADLFPLLVNFETESAAKGEKDVIVLDDDDQENEGEEEKRKGKKARGFI